MDGTVEIAAMHLAIGLAELGREDVARMLAHYLPTPDAVAASQREAALIIQWAKS